MLLYLAFKVPIDIVGILSK